MSSRRNRNTTAHNLLVNIGKIQYMAPCKNRNSKIHASLDISFKTGPLQGICHCKNKAERGSVY